MPLACSLKNSVRSSGKTMSTFFIPNKFKNIALQTSRPVRLLIDDSEQSSERGL